MVMDRPQFDIGKVGDTSYLGDYVYSEESEFNLKFP